MQGTWCSWQYWATILSLVIQGISLVAIIRPIAEARQLIGDGAASSLDGGNAAAESNTEDISEVAIFLLRQAASPYIAIMAIALSLALQLLVAIVPVDH